MTNVQDEHELVEHNKQNALSATIAAAVKYFPNGLMKRVAFGSHVATFRILLQTFYRLPCTLDPCAGGIGSVLGNVVAGRATIILGIRCDNDAVLRPSAQASRSRSSNTSSTERPMPFLA
jgi:hypothetical protein